MREAAEGAPSFVHLPQLGAVGATLEIAGDEAHYLARVVRVRAGERVCASDGEGGLATLEIERLAPSLRARVIEREQRMRVAELELWCGAPKGDRADWMVEKLAELGVARLVPIEAERGRWERFERRRERWERLASAALRQSRSAFRMHVLEPLALEPALTRTPGAAARWCARPDGGPATRIAAAARGPTIVAIGPSSGFSQGELKRLQESGFTAVALAETRLRTETAALAAAAVWAAAACGNAGAPPSS
jgi:16S rRNA (uracil1498-N3)-methyltransferase